MLEKACTLKTCKKVECLKEDCEIKKILTADCSSCDKLTLDEYQCTGMCMNIYCPDCRENTKICQECKKVTCDKCIKSSVAYGGIQELTNGDIICEECLDEIRFSARVSTHSILEDLKFLESMIKKRRIELGCEKE